MAQRLSATMPQPVTAHCINPDCPRPYPQIGGNKFCNSCGSPLRLKDRYIPLQRLGAGGFAIIYTIWDLVTETEQVLKVLVEVSPKALTLFEQEAAVLASLRQHPGVPKVEADGYFLLNLGQKYRQLPCLVMEKINGHTLEKLLEQYPQGCPEALVLDWLNQAVEILQQLHSHQIIHRDLKPSNLMIRSAGGTQNSRAGQLVMIDFGGAKQIGSSRRVASSTRLFSAGYSPPEQVVGGAVGPSADFYALGRTMIELLTGKSLPELEDPATGKLKWHHLVSVSPALGDLLDDMVQEDVRRRLASAAKIQARLAKISNTQAGLHYPLSLDIAPLTKSLFQTTNFLFKVVIHLLRACLDTVRGMVLSTIGSCVGTAIGFVLAYWLPVGAEVAEFTTQYLPGLIPRNQIAGAEIVLFAAAGMGTAWGLIVTGGFGQRRRYIVAPLTGLLSYGCGWLVWLAIAPHTEIGALLGSIAVAVALLTLGLGLPSHHLVHAIVAASGTTAIFALLVSLHLVNLALFQLYNQPSWLEFLLCIAFSSSVSVTLSFWLGVSYYLVVPCLRLIANR